MREIIGENFPIVSYSSLKELEGQRKMILISVRGSESVSNLPQMLSGWILHCTSSQIPIT